MGLFTKSELQLTQTKQICKYKKTIRILVYPNITFQKDITKDSYIHTITNQIVLLNKLRSDLWFYLILPTYSEQLNFSNVTQMYIKIPTYPPTMRSHFDVFKIKQLLSHNLDFDIIMSHLPEHTHQLKNLLYNTTHHVPLFFGYCHWFDLKEIVTWTKDSFNQNILGLLEYDKCYINTFFQKEKVLNQSKEVFNSSTINKLNKILEVHHLGVNKENIVNQINFTPNKIIVFNHRPDTYKNFKNFMRLMDKLRTLRTDFKVWIPLLQKPNRDWVIVTKGNKKQYYEMLQKCLVGFAPKQKYGGWSISTTDGMMNGVPYIMYDAPYYHELNKNGLFFKTDTEAIQLFQKFFNKTYRNKKASETLKYTKNHLLYDLQIQSINTDIEHLLKKTYTINTSKGLDNLITYIKTKKYVTKEQIMKKLKWGRGIKWTPYRRGLLNHPNIYDTLSKIPTYNWIEKE